MTKTNVPTVLLVSFVVLSATLANVLVLSASDTPTVTIFSSGKMQQQIPVVNAVVHKALLCWGGVPSEDVGFAAQFDWIYMSSETYQLIPSIRLMNPNILIIGYVESESPTSGSSPYNNFTVSFPETCYFHDVNGNRLHFADGTPFMNISDPTWQGICASSAAWLVANGCDGVMVDDVWANFYTGIYGLNADPAPSASWWNSYDTGAKYTRWQTAMRTLLTAVQVAVGKKVVCYNGSQGGSTVYPDVCGAANLEDFAFTGATDTLNWINTLETLSVTGKYVIAEPHNQAADTEANYLYGLCCYMLGMNGPNTYYCFKSYWASSKGFYSSDFNRNFGRPLGSKVQVAASVWTREFENCTVTADFQSQTGQIVMR